MLNLSNFTKMSFDLQRNGAESFLGETLEGWLGRKSKNILNCLQKSITLRIFMNIFFLRNNEDYASIIVQYHCVYWSNQATGLAPINNAINLIKFEHHSPFTGSYMRILRTIITFMMKMIKYGILLMIWLQLWWSNDDSNHIQYVNDQSKVKHKGKLKLKLFHSGVLNQSRIGERGRRIWERLSEKCYQRKSDDDERCGEDCWD